MANNTINIVHLYAKEMNIYGDNGNVQVLIRRLEWRGIIVVAHRVGIGDDIPENTHLIIGGGGQDAGQTEIAEDLQAKAPQLRLLADNNVPMLMICGMYQMFGHYFKTQQGNKIPGIGILDIHTIAGEGRLIGNSVVASQWGDLVGYENHSGLSYLGSKARPLATSKTKQGNNGKDTTEGAWQNFVFGSYLHGPVLAKAPVFADYLLAQALVVAKINEPLALLDDRLELRAAQAAKKRSR